MYGHFYAQKLCYFCSRYQKATVRVQVNQLPQNTKHKHESACHVACTRPQPWIYGCSIIKYT